MAGFMKLSLVGEYSNQKVVNVLHYRSATWTPGQGNPFDDILAAMDDVWTALSTAWLGALPSGYKLNELNGVGYDDAYGIVTPSPLIRTIDEFGGLPGNTNGAAPCVIVSLRCGAQVQINNVGTSLRNRGYLAVGPVRDVDVDELSHIGGVLFADMDALAQEVCATVVSLGTLGSIIPIRVHEKWARVLGVDVLLWRTYSDVLGYRVNRVASFRRSRVPEA
jgi:hypothetical protein